jgi:hypothetical protein
LGAGSQRRVSHDCLFIVSRVRAHAWVGHAKLCGYLPLHPGTHALIHDYLDAAGHGTDENGGLFRPIRNNRTGRLERAITGDRIYRLVRAYSSLLGFEIGAHSLRATAATNALDHEADIANVQEWLALVIRSRLLLARCGPDRTSPGFVFA